MTVLPVTSTASPSLPAQSARSAMLTSDFETFLRMLTVQIRNQDPMSPMQSTEFATQLATFAGVEQQVRANEQLAALSRQLNVSTMAQLSGWIGMEARIAAPAAFAGAPIMLAPNPPQLADSAVLVVRNQQGFEVQRLPIPVSAAPIEWVGLDAAGNPLPAGTYRFELEASAGGELLGSGPVEHYALVREARGNAQGGIDLVFDGGITVAAADATALRKPGAL
ncbi:MAG: flagellar hook capping FlgD N-terminal domain-containing protein [Gemmobacter sp.]|uniref:flagellar hook capping FlgD N-terminal domain-containing protein n=1 Tax=Gemmobacter sp. TaxID=1898957 RepID=UPI00391DFB18